MGIIKVVMSKVCLDDRFKSQKGSWPYRLIQARKLIKGRVKEDAKMLVGEGDKQMKQI